MWNHPDLCQEEDSPRGRVSDTDQLINSLIIQGEYFEIPHIETETCVLASYTSTMILTFVPDLDIAERQRGYVSCSAVSP